MTKEPREEKKKRQLRNRKREKRETESVLWDQPDLGLNLTY